MWRQRSAHKQRLRRCLNSIVALAISGEVSGDCMTLLSAKATWRCASPRLSLSLSSHQVVCTRKQIWQTRLNWPIAFNEFRLLRLLSSVFVFQDTVRRIKAIAKKDENCAAGATRYLMQRMAAKSSEVHRRILHTCVCRAQPWLLSLKAPLNTQQAAVLPCRGLIAVLRPTGEGTCLGMAFSLRARSTSSFVPGVSVSTALPPKTQLLRSMIVVGVTKIEWCFFLWNENQARFMALSILGLLFQRSRVVRKLVVADLKVRGGRGFRNDRGDKRQGSHVKDCYCCCCLL